MSTRLELFFRIHLPIILHEEDVIEGQFLNRI